MRILILYNARQTYTSTVFEHVDAFRECSRHDIFYHHLAPGRGIKVDLDAFDAVAVHYTIRLPFDQLGVPAADRLASYDGLKLLFIQDEYDNTNRAKYWIQRIGFDLVFTVVPERSIQVVYPREQFGKTRFVSNITGYAPRCFDNAIGNLKPPSRRDVILGYRGRPLPIHYGQLGMEKVVIGRRVKDYCAGRGLKCDIAWGEEDRIYGAQWYAFIAGCRGMLGSESGSNVFDWDGTLGGRVDAFRRAHPKAEAEDVYQTVVRPLEHPGLMNQASPRIFEMIAARTAMVLLEGHYSGIVKPDRHYIPLKKDFSNLDEVFEKLFDDDLVDTMTDSAWYEILESGEYSYAAFVARFDAEVDALRTGIVAARERVRPLAKSGGECEPMNCSAHPMMSTPPVPVNLPPVVKKMLLGIWLRLPINVREIVLGVLGRA
jgi:hypothetical protein